MKDFKNIIGISFEEFYNQHKTPLILFLKKMKDDDRYDIELLVDECFIRFLQYYKNINVEIATYKTYLYTIGINALKSKLRDRKKQIKLYDFITDFDYIRFDIADDNEGYDWEYENKLSALETDVNEYGSEIVNMRFYSGSTYKYIAEKTNVKTQDVKNRLRSFKQKMKKKYGL